jgi:asparagine synthetase B (glutamine-hydrolysing)
MCTFLVTNRKNLTNTDFLKSGGPDGTSTIVRDGITFTHNLLSVTGEYTLQPIEQYGRLFYLLGEVYNRNMNYRSDVYDVAHAWNTQTLNSLQGEYLLLIYENSILHIITDTWSTRQVYYTKYTDDEWALSTLPLLNTSERLMSNSHYIMHNNILTHLSYMRSWNLDQNVQSYDRIYDALWNAIDSRWTKNAVVLLSGGVDSSVIALRYAETKRPFRSLTLKINDVEDNNTLNSLLNVTKEYNTNYIMDTYDENFHPIWGAAQYVSNTLDSKVMIVGHGADEIYCNYNNKKKMNDFNNPFDVWPDDLSDVFPYRHFYDGLMRKHLDTYETNSLSHGVEIRNTYCDVNLTQEWLNLTPNLKNTRHKDFLLKYMEKCEVSIPNKIAAMSMQHTKYKSL